MISCEYPYTGGNITVTVSLLSDVLDLQTTYKAILEAARDGRLISYGDLAQANGAKWQKVRRAMNHHLGDLVEIAADRGAACL